MIRELRIRGGPGYAGHLRSSRRGHKGLPRPKKKTLIEGGRQGGQANRGKLRVRNQRKRSIVEKQFLKKHKDP